MDIANTDLETIIKGNIQNDIIEDDVYIYNLFKEIIVNVLIELKKLNLYHMDIKPVNILMTER